MVKLAFDQGCGVGLYTPEESVIHRVHTEGYWYSSEEGRA